MTQIKINATAKDIKSALQAAQEQALRIQPVSDAEFEAWCKPDEAAAGSCFMCHGKGEHQMASAWLPGQPEIKPVMVKCQQCKPNAAVETKGCIRCNTPQKCSIYGCSPNTWEPEKAVEQERLYVDVLNEEIGELKARYQAREDEAHELSEQIIRDREAMRLALDALKESRRHHSIHIKGEAAIAALEKVLK